MNWLDYLSIFSPLIAIIVGGVGIKKVLKSKAATAVLIFAVAAFVFELWSLFLANQKSITTTILYFYALIETLIVAYLFLQILWSNKIKIFISAIVLIFLVSALSILMRVSNGEEPLFGKITTAESVIFILAGAFYFYEVMQKTEIPNIYKHPPFWFVSAFFFYFSGSFFIFTVAGDLLNVSDYKSFNEIWTLHAILNIIQKIFLTLGLFWVLKE